MAKAQSDIEKQDDTKLALENVFIREVNSLFVQMNKENAQTIIAEGKPLLAEKYRSAWESLLSKHYGRVQSVFNGSVEETLPKEERGLSDEELAMLIAAFMLWRNENAKTTAQIITNTNQNQINQSMNQARDMFLDENERTPTNRELSRDTSAVFRTKYRSRSSMIAETETQRAAESTKLMEVALLSGQDPKLVLRPSIPARMLAFKRWNTLKDKVVRELHKRLEGRKIQINQAFETGGERLMHPGDSSLGASAKNIAHCRCALTFEFKRVRR